MELTEEQIIEFIETFNLFDEDHDGLISLEQMKSIFKSIGSNIKLDLYLWHWFTWIKNSSLINVQEFLSFIETLNKTNKIKSDLIEFFKVIDRDGTERVSVSDIKYLYKINSDK